ncbi:hypothetical protein Ndes2526B_g08505 [Nannochloris sp. 'desiccata']
MTNTADSTANRRSPFEDGNYYGAPKLPKTTLPHKSVALQQNVTATATNGALASAAAPIVLDEDDYNRMHMPSANNNKATASGIGNDGVGEYQDHQQEQVVDVNFLQLRLAAAEAESARHVQIISSMHEWAYKTTTSLRQVQEKCENAENRANKAEEEVMSLKHQLTQVAAQVEAMVVAAASPLHAPAAHGGGTHSPTQNDAVVQSKRRRKKVIPRVNTLTSLAADGHGNFVSPIKTSINKNSNI